MGFGGREGSSAGCERIVHVGKTRLTRAQEGDVAVASQMVLGAP